MIDSVGSQTFPQQQLLLRLQGFLLGLPHCNFGITQHLTSPKHQNLMKGSQYCHDIKELCGRFKGPQTAIKPRKARATKTKKINKVTVLRSCGSGRETSAEDSPKTAEPLIRQ